MIQKKFNHAYSAGIPLNLGDRYYGQDLGRDFYYLMDRMGLLLADTTQQSKIIVSGGVITAGATPATQINISALVGYIKQSVTIPNTFAALPPSTMAADIELLRVAIPAQVNIVVATYGATNGLNYVKVAYKDTNGNSRARAKKAGSYNYELVPDFTLTITTVAPTAYEICLGEVTVTAGSITAITVANRDSYTQIVQPHYDSGWITQAAGADTVLTHNLGGSMDKYIIDMQMKAGSGGAPGIDGYGIYYNGVNQVGWEWRALSTTQITFTRGSAAGGNDYGRLRIWKHA